MYFVMKNEAAKVVIINGYPGSGKDTFVQLCKDRYPWLVSNIHTSNPAKDALRGLGWSGEKDGQSRALLAQLIKQSYDLYNGPVRYVKSFHDRLYEGCSTKDCVMFVHCREPENIDKFKEVFPDLITLFVNRDEAADKDFTNFSDSGVANYNYDLYLDNNGSLDDLKDAVQTVMSEINNWGRFS